MHVFFCDNINSNSGVLDKTESAHAIRVLRLKIGDTIVVLDGAGAVHHALINGADAKACAFAITQSQTASKRKVSLHVAIAPTKMNDRMEWFLEKAVEMGIEKITPVLCEHSERRNVNMERFQKVIKAALKQSMQPYLPVLYDPVALPVFLKTAAPGFIAHCNSAVDHLLERRMPEMGEVCVLIGPEGDFSPNEVAQAIKGGWLPVSLGTSRLRTETAGVYVCALTRTLNEKINQSK
ncbi:MAG TPA: 16S rRNA (uracil(1498)-N(3))-methyltransferase [Bacteroidia bacterium]|nr:16S rRNA (uracil(1498)-N(3))-methyltransferase [Bacteroidia bacterium]